LAFTFTSMQQVNPGGAGGAGNQQQPGLNVPPQAPGLAPPLANHQTYYDLYGDPQADQLRGNYETLFQEYGTGVNTPAQLRTRIYNAANSGSFLHILAHVRAPDAPAADPGTIVCLHRLSRHDTPFGQQVRPYDDKGLAFFGDVIGGQAPNTVELPDQHFNQLTAVVQAPTMARFEQLIAADADAEAFGPFAAEDPDVEPITTRSVVVVPNIYARPFLTQGMSPKAALLALRGMIAMNGDQDSCEALIDWLRVTLVRRAANQWARTVVPPLVPPTFASPATQQDFTRYRLSLLHRDLPGTQPGMVLQSAQLIAQGISTLSHEQRQIRLDAEARHQAKEAAKTPADYWGPQLPKLMRWTQTAAEGELPRIYATIANAKKSRVRSIIQLEVEDTLQTYGYLPDFPVSPAMASKVVDLKWASPLKDDFTVGLNLFALGSLDEETMELQRQRNTQADALGAGEAAPTLGDLETIHDTSTDLSIPTTFAHLRYNVERAIGLWHVLWGPHHEGTTQHQRFRETLVMKEKQLERVVPRNPKHHYLVPALLARTIQLTVNHWLEEQGRTAVPLPFPNLTKVFQLIALERNWEPTFPTRYLKTHPTPLVEVITDASSAGSTLTPTTTSASTGSLSASVQPKNEYLANQAYDVARFGHFNALGLGHKDLRKRLSELKVAIPKTSFGHTMCLSYHIKGGCNSQCRFSSGHGKLDVADAQKLHDWCTTHYKPAA
jgi:hypothetical protein